MHAEGFFCRLAQMSEVCRLFFSSVGRFVRPSDEGLLGRIVLPRGAAKVHQGRPASGKDLPPINLSRGPKLTAGNLPASRRQEN